MTFEELKKEAEKHGFALVEKRRIIPHSIRYELTNTEFEYGLNEPEMFSHIKKQMACEMGVALQKLMTLKEEKRSTIRDRDSTILIMSLNVIAPKIV